MLLFKFNLIFENNEDIIYIRFIKVKHEKKINVKMAVEKKKNSAEPKQHFFQLL